MRPRSSNGLTLIEVVIVMAIAGTMLAVAAPRLGLPTGRQTADQFASLLHSARLQAISGEPTAVVVDAAGGNVFIVTPARGCDGPVSHRLPVPAGVKVKSTLRSGVMWQPDGSGRTCGGSGIYGGTVTFQGRQTWKVVVSSLGRVRVTRADNG